MVINDFSTTLKIESLGDKPVLSVMEDIKNLLKDFPYWFAAGTALGLKREECGYIKYDTDIDMEAYVKDSKAIRELLEKNGFKISREQIINNKCVQQCYMYRDILVDIYFYEEKEKELINYNEHGTLDIPIEMIHNIEEVRGFKCPGPIEDYLVYRYGPDWKTPTGRKIDWAICTGEALKKND